MIYCESPTLEQWVAPPYEDFPRPTWTRLRAAGVELSNSIEYANWTADPVEPIVCEGCWTTVCARTVARVVRLGEHLLWLPPGPSDIDESCRDPSSKANFIREAVLIPVATWDRLRKTLHQLPTPHHFRRATRGDVAAVWLREMPEEIRVTELGRLEARLREALASDPLDPDPAREVVRSMVGWVLQSPGQPVAGAIVRAQACGSAVNTFYFDGPPFPEWPAFVVARDNSFVLGAEWLFLSKEAGAEPGATADGGRDTGYT